MSGDDVTGSGVGVGVGVSCVTIGGDLEGYHQVLVLVVGHHWKGGVSADDVTGSEPTGAPQTWIPQSNMLGLLIFLHCWF